MTERERRKKSPLGFWSFVALGAGLGIGVYGFESGSPAVAVLAGLAQPLGAVWLNALQMAVVPLVVMQLLTAIAGSGNGGSVGRAGKRAVVVIVTLLSCVSVASYLVSIPLVRFLSVSTETVEAIKASVLVPPSLLEVSGQRPQGLGAWIQGMVPPNAFEAFVQGNLIQVLLFTVLFGLAVSRLPEERRTPLGEIFESLSEAILVAIRWILMATPVGVFALIIGLALRTGTETVGLLGAYLAMLSGLTLLFSGLMYPVAALLGRVPISLFAKAAAAPQLVGLSTRSSLASMPAQITSGQTHLGFGKTTSGFTVPLCVSALKIRHAFQNPLRLLFLAHIFAVGLSPTQVLTFLITILLISFTSLGIPRGGTAFRTLPAYLAVGIPVEGLVLLEAVRDLADYGDTLANTTGQFAAATVLSRDDR